MRTFAAVLCAVMLVSCRGDADFSGVLKTETLNPDEYRDQITAVDRLVFRNAPLGNDGIRALQDELDRLGESIAAPSHSNFVRIERLELKQLAGRARRLSPADSGSPLQNDWMRIRNNLFDDRAWFARSAADLESTESTSTSAAVVAPPAGPSREESTRPAVTTAPRTTLTGRWKVTSILANGQPRDDAEMRGSLWSFEAPRLVIRDAQGRETLYDFSVAGDELQISAPGGKQGWMKYAPEGDGFRIAFFDNLEGKPAGFEPEPGRTSPLLVVVHLSPID